MRRKTAILLRYYPDGEPWMEPTGTNRYTFGGKERVNLGGPIRNDV